MSIAQSKGITKEFELHGRFYAIDSTTIDLCLSVFRWAKFRSTKSGIKIHTQIDIATEILVFYRISHATMHDTKFMDQIIYQCNACYVFDRAYFDLSRLYAIEQAGAFFIIREKFHPDYQITDGEDLLEGDDNILRDQTVRFTGKRNSKNYPIPLRRIIYFAPDLGRTFTYILPVTFTLKPKTLPFFTATDGRLNCSSSGLSSICVSSLFGENLRTLSEYRYILQSSPIAWS
ncbi:MAG: transposase [Bacteroidales bacterium]|nr:transposase [Bacteroidales bacterium]